MTNTLEPKNRVAAHVDVDKSTQAEAASAHARINIPLNLENWRDYDKDTTESLLWFHQHILDSRMTWDECCEALGYKDRSTIFRALKGTYGVRDGGSIQNVRERITSYRKVAEARAQIQKNEFVENRITKRIFAALDYALANSSITLIEGDSRMGKSFTGREWQARNNHGRSVYVIVPPYGGTKALLRAICRAIGAGVNQSTVQSHDAILRAFNRNRILILDEAHRLLPADRRTYPVNLEIIRDLHDQSGCAVAFLATRRLGAELRKGDYMFEQVLGRIGMPARLPKNVIAADILPILSQYVRRPSGGLVETCLQVANKPGRLGILVESLKVASRIAAKHSSKMTEEHVLKALKLRDQMSAEMPAKD